MQAFDNNFRLPVDLRIQQNQIQVSQPSTSSSATGTLTACEKPSSLTVSDHDSKPASTNKSPSMPAGKKCCTTAHNAHTKLW